MSSRLVSVVVAAGLLLGTAAPARAHWLREDWIGFQGETRGARLHLLDFAVYESESGLGVGIEGIQAALAPLDVPRAGLPDASAHALYEPLPLKAYLALASWKGPTYWHAAEIAEDRSIGKVELYGSYCDWARLTEFNDVGPFGREAVAGALRARIIEYGVRVDQGLGESFALAGSVGKRELTAYGDGTFRGKRSDAWFAAFEVYFGVTKGTDYGGGVGRMLGRVGDELLALFGGPVIHREPLPSTTP